MANKICVLDSTLRDGAQAEGISFSVNDKLRIVKALDDFGIDIIEAGNPTSNPKDMEFFKEIKKIKLSHSKIAAFGSTRKINSKVEDDAMVASLLSAETPVVVIFGKSWDLHVKKILNTTLEENLAMIKETVKYLKAKGKTVVYDAEHFFDGYKNNSDYAIKSIMSAQEGGADTIVLCDTNGGCFPDEVFEITKNVVSLMDTEIGIHVHNDTGMGDANTIMAVKAGATHIQGTMLGFGERCGNANLSTVICNLQIKLGYECIPNEGINNITSLCRMVAEISNKKLVKNMPYVGESAFTHKAGMHIDGVNKISKSFEHVEPNSVGNNRRFLMSEVSGRSTVLKMVNKIDPTITKNNEVLLKIVAEIKRLEFEGFQFEGAEASLDLLIRKQLNTYKPFFTLEKYKTIGEQLVGAAFQPASALVKVRVKDKSELTAAEGDGPVDALNLALRTCLEKFYPSLSEMHLADYKVRIIDGKDGTSATVRVLIDNTDGKQQWSTVGVSKDIIQASLQAMVDAIEYKLTQEKLNK
ncbi:MAG: citramalate synthase [Clostridia bacterium]